MKIWIDMDEYKGLKPGDSVKRNDGCTDVYGNPWDTEGVITAIKYWHKDETAIWLEVAENGDKDRIILMQPDQVKKIDKEFVMHENGKMKLFEEVRE